MKFLAVDIGTGTQDIYLFQSGLAIENGFKLEGLFKEDVEIFRWEISDGELQVNIRYSR